MAIETAILEKERVVLVTIDGIVDADQIEAMRRECVAYFEETGIEDVIVDMRELESLKNAEPGAIVDLGSSFKNHNITVWSNTAVLMPLNPSAYEQIELMLTIELNRGRGLMNYVESIDEAISWFEEMARRVSTPATSGQFKPPS